MVVGNVPEAADIIVAGAGPGGYVAALRAAQAGRNVMLIDEHGGQGVGGVCLHTGCIPSKTLIEAAALFHRVQACGYGISVSNCAFDMQAFQTVKSQVVTRLTGGVNALLKAAGVKVLAGRVSVTDHDTVIVNTPDGNVQFFTFRGLILATGSSVIELPKLAFDERTVLSSTGVLALETLPESIAVIGAGYIGIELGIALAKLGVQVTLVDKEARVLPLMASSLSGVVEKQLAGLGVKFLASRMVTGFDAGTLELEHADGERGHYEVDKVVVAVGRAPNTRDLGLDAIGVRLNADGRVCVSADRRLSEKIVAIGDITPGPALAHKAMAEAQIAVDALLGERVGFDALVAEIVFSDPEIGSVGLSQSQAIAQDIDAGVAQFPISASGRALTLHAKAGFTQIVYDRADGSVLGAHIAGPHASELVAQAVVAIEMNATVEDLSLMVWPHPTLSESLGEAAHVAMGNPLHAVHGEG